MTKQPTGTVTFLFTDIEGSTKLWEHHPEAMQKALARHDELLRQIIATHKGYVFKTVGDAFYAAFNIAPNAPGSIVCPTVFVSGGLGRDADQSPYGAAHRNSRRTRRNAKIFIEHG